MFGHRKSSGTFVLLVCATLGLLSATLASAAPAADCCNVVLYGWSEELLDDGAPHASDVGSNGSSDGEFKPPMFLIMRGKARVNYHAVLQGTSFTVKRRYRMAAQSFVGAKVESVCEGWYYRWAAEGRFKGGVFGESDAVIACSAWGAATAGQELAQDLGIAEAQQVNSDTDGEMIGEIGIGSDGPNAVLGWSSGSLSATKEGGKDHKRFTKTDEAGGPGPITQVKWTGRGEIYVGAVAHLGLYGGPSNDADDKYKLKAKGRAYSKPYATVGQTIRCSSSVTSTTTYGWTVGWPPYMPPKRRPITTTPSGTSTGPEENPPVTDAGPLGPGASPSGNYPNSAEDPTIPAPERKPGWWRAGSDDDIDHPEVQGG